MLTLKQKLKLCGLALGIFGCYTVFGLLQEKIFRGRYGAAIDPVDGKVGERYRLPWSFGLIQDVFYTIVAKGLIIAMSQPKTETSQFIFALASLFYVLGKLTSHLSLQWVPYPTQIVGKASKPIPVMIMGALIVGKRYTLRKVLFVLTIVFGVGLFIFKDKYEEKDGEDPLLGSALIGISLLFDGLCGATEDKMRATSKPTAFNLMYYMFMWSTVFHSIGVVASGEIPKFIDFVSRNPEILKYFGGIAFVGSFGQLFITKMIVSFGALPLSITTTTRKFFSVILSVIIYQNSLSLRQWFAAVLIFGTLLVDGVLSKSMKEPEKSELKDDVEIADKEKEQTAGLIEIELQKTQKEEIKQ